MTVGADKIIELDPPGTIGLYDKEAVLIVRFDEEATTTRPQDEGGVLDDLDVTVTGTGTMTMPEVGAGVIGRARIFDPDALTGLGARDKVSGTTLLTRDMTIQVVLSWDIVAQNASGLDGTIISRGLGGSAAEYCPFGLRLQVVDVATFTGRLQWYWQDAGGTQRVQTGASIVLVPGTFTMLTATRRWVSPTSVVLRYYVGDLLVGEVASADGSIGGGTTGALQIGTRFSAGDDEAFFAGSIDEIMLLDREISQEEIEATWLRITLYQPRGYRLFLEMHDRDFPLSDDPASDAQLDTRMTGVVLGFAAAQIENLRANFLPGRAYGSVLEDWEKVVRPAASPTPDIDARRARVVARFRQRRGSSPDGIRDVLQDLIGEASVDDLEIISFSTTNRDEFADPAADPNRLRWDFEPLTWTAPSGNLKCLPLSFSGDYLMNGLVRTWKTCRRSVGGNAVDATFIAKVSMTAAAGSEAGIYFENAPDNQYILLGLRNDAGTYRLIYERFVANVSQGVVVLTTFGATPANLWLKIHRTAETAALPDGFAAWRLAWSTTSQTTGYTESGQIGHPDSAQWAGCYLRSYGGTIVAAPEAHFDETVLRDPFSNRALNAYVLLDETLGFTPDVRGAQSAIAALAHGYVHGAFITKPFLLFGDPDTVMGIDPMGGY